jgi:hypothetical protein
MAQGVKGDALQAGQLASLIETMPKIIIVRELA